MMQDRQSIQSLVGSALAGLDRFPPDSKHEVWARALDPIPGNFVGRTSQGKNVLITPASARDVHLRLNDAVFHSRRRLEWSYQDEEQRGSVATLEMPGLTVSDDNDFEVVVSTLLYCAPSLVESDQMIELVDAWFTSLRSQSQPTFQQLVGLWGELFAIVSAPDPCVASLAWQWRDREPIDFTSVRANLEVKTSSQGGREHSTNLAQITAGQRLEAAFLSISAPETPEGISLVELRDFTLGLVEANPLARQTVSAAFVRRAGLSVSPDQCRLSPTAAFRSRRLLRMSDISGLPSSPAIVRADFVFDFDRLPCLEASEFLAQQPQYAHLLGVGTPTLLSSPGPGGSR